MVLFLLDCNKQQLVSLANCLLSFLNEMLQLYLPVKTTRLVVIKCIIYQLTLNSLISDKFANPQ